MLISGFENYSKSEDLEKIKIKWVKIKKDDDDIEELSGPMLDFMGSFYKKELGNLFIDLETTSDGGTVTVPAGNFSGCTKTQTLVEFLGDKYSSTVWLHSDVPINGMVKSISNNGKMITELIDFGLSGAKKSF